MPQDTEDEQPAEVGPSRDLAAKTAAVSQRCKSSRGKKHSRAAHVAVATMMGAGKNSRQISKELGIPARTVRDLVVRAERDPELADVRQKAVERLRDQAIEILGRRLGTLDGGFDGASLKEQSAAFREIREVAMPRQWNEFTPPSAGPQFKLQTENPQVMASFVEALRMLNEPSGKTVEAQIVSEETK